MTNTVCRPEITRSQVVRARDFNQHWFVDRATELGHGAYPIPYHRKIWEHVVIAQVFKDTVGFDTHAPKVIGFGVGKEPLPSWFASHCADVTATDGGDVDDCWEKTDQHSSSLASLPRVPTCTPLQHSQIMFEQVDMNHIPYHHQQGQYDFTWSAGSFEHLGSIMSGIEFFLNSMKCLRPGGIAAHTTEYRVGSEDSSDTHAKGGTVLYTQSDLHRLADLLKSQGDRLYTLDFERGYDPPDNYVDQPPFFSGPKPYHLSLLLGRFVTTSILLVAERGGM